jgi:Tfp pilus assembly protein PilV
MEGVLYIFIQSLVNKKQEQYSKMPLQSIQEIFTAIDVNIKSDYSFNKNTIIYCVNCIDKTCVKTSLSKSQINNINSYDPIYRGKALYDLIKN